MIHHVSIPAREPERVARVLAELLGGYAGPFIGPIPGAWVAYAEDGVGTGIEVYTEDTVIVPGENDTLGSARPAAPPPAVAFHALISVKASRADIERVGAREGWRTLHFWRGPPGQRLFELYEFWVENRVMLELATEDMVGNYVKIANGPAQRQLLAARRAATG
ncbi:MAG TPA: hypothetical protein VFS13_15630 [Steroidobacteraceae bacterium]|nr:hypothetical protein [Steroidobacteraceae bacterium]